MKPSHGQDKFICPECGSVEALPVSLRKAPRANPGPRREVVCARCGFEIPLHLAERWGGLSVAEAQKEWVEVYRDLARGECAALAGGNPFG
jgi:predicted RNA-binding Zn-ribbon protein involved in translation (DUF1610 family)